MTDNFDYGEKLESGQYEDHPTIDEGEFVEPIRHVYIHDDCGGATKMTTKLAASWARDPDYYDYTFCLDCGDYYPVEDFAWKDTGNQLGDTQ